MNWWRDEWRVFIWGRVLYKTIWLKRRIAYYQQNFRDKRGDYPKAEQFYERAITLPLFPKMTRKNVDRVIKAVKRVFRCYRNGFVRSADK